MRRLLSLDENAALFPRARIAASNEDRKNVYECDETGPRKECFNKKGASRASGAERERPAAARSDARMKRSPVALSSNAPGAVIGHRDVFTSTRASYPDSISARNGRNERDHIDSDGDKAAALDSAQLNRPRERSTG